MAHLTCVGHTREELERDPRVLRARPGVRNVLALRGDPRGRARARRGRRPPGGLDLRLRAGRAGPRRSATSASASRPSPRATRRRSRCDARRRRAGGQGRGRRRVRGHRDVLPGRATTSASSSGSAAAGVDIPILPGHHADPEPRLDPPDGRAVRRRGARRGRWRRIAALDGRPGRRARRGHRASPPSCARSCSPAERPGLHFYTLNRSRATLRDLRGPARSRSDGGGATVLACAPSPSPATARPGSRPTPPWSGSGRVHRAPAWPRPSPAPTARPRDRRRPPAVHDAGAGRARPSLQIWTDHDQHGRPDRLPGAALADHPLPRRRGRRRPARPRSPSRSVTGSRSRASRWRWPTSRRPAAAAREAAYADAVDRGDPPRRRSPAPSSATSRTSSRAAPVGGAGGRVAEGDGATPARRSSPARPRSARSVTVDVPAR